MDPFCSYVYKVLLTQTVLHLHFIVAGKVPPRQAHMHPSDSASGGQEPLPRPNTTGSNFLFFLLVNAENFKHKKS